MDNIILRKDQVVIPVALIIDWVKRLGEVERAAYSNDPFIKKSIERASEVKKQLQKFLPEAQTQQQERTG